MNMGKEKDHNDEVRLVDKILERRLYLSFIGFVLSCHLKYGSSNRSKKKGSFGKVGGGWVK